VISYDEMLELASLGAGVMHSRSIEFAKKFGVPIHVRSSFSDIEGTMIVAEPESRSAAVSGAALTRDECRVTILSVPDVPGTSLGIFSAISARKIAIDMVVQNVGQQGLADISFTVSAGELDAVLEAVKKPAAALGAAGVVHDKNLSKVSVVGLGMASQTGVASRMFRALADAGVNIQMITTSEIKISALVPRDHADAALRAVHQAFTLDSAPADAKSWDQIRADRAKTADVQALVSRLRDDALEELTLTGISVSGTQARITLHGVPDHPGIAAKVFETIGKAGIFVDMIVQGYDGEDGSTSISFTTDEGELKKAIEVARQICEEHGMRSAQGAGGIVKVTVSGIGLRSHTQVAEILFKTLADAQINVQMINTSELQVNTVIAADSAEEAHARILAAFSKALDHAA
jgi:aspartate kinase